MRRREPYNTESEHMLSKTKSSSAGAKTKNFQKGRYGESLALSYLQNKGYIHIQSNFHTRFGEIDLIMSCTGDPACPPLEGCRPTLIFIEVKYKSPSSPGIPEQMISRKKINQILRTAQSFLSQNPQLAKDFPSYRIDAICIVGSIIKHYQNITL